MVPEMKEVTNLVQCKRPGNVAVEPDEEGALLLVVQTPLRFFPVSRQVTLVRREAERVSIYIVYDGSERCNYEPTDVTMEPLLFEPILDCVQNGVAVLLTLRHHRAEPVENIAEFLDICIHSAFDVAQGCAANVWSELVI